MDSTTLLWGVVFGAIGTGFFIYGKKQKAPLPLVTGAALFVVPYFISNVYLLVIVGAVLTAVPYFIQL